MIHAFAPGLSVDVRDNPPSVPAASVATGVMIVYAPGLTVEVRELAPQGMPEIVTIPVNFSRVTCLEAQYSGGRYVRYTRPLILRVATIHERFELTNLDPGGGAINVGFEFPRYALKVNGVERASYTRTQTQHVVVGSYPTGSTSIQVTGTIVTDDVVRFAGDPNEYRVTKGAIAPASITISHNVTLPAPVKLGLRVALTAGATLTATERFGYLDGALGNEPDGLARFDLVGINDTTTILLMTFWGYIDRNGAAKNEPNTVVQTSSYAWAHWKTPYQYAIVPKGLLWTSRAKPRPFRLPVPFTHEASASDLTLLNYVAPGDGTPTTRPAVNAAGVTLTDAMQEYFFNDMTGTDPRPRLPQCDGPFGTATLSMVSDVQYTRALNPDGTVRFMKFLASTPYRSCIINYAGNVHTINGIRHKTPPLWSEEQGTVTAGYVDRWDHIEYVGNWPSSVPLRERFPLESWGSWVDPRTTVSDMNAPLISGLPPHPGPIIGFRSDAHGFILKETFGNNDFFNVANVERWKPALDPWGLAGFGDVLFCCERNADAITMTRISDKAPLGNFVEGPHNLGGLNASRVWEYALGPDSVTDPNRFKIVRTFDCVGPEGLRIAKVNGVWYAYWGQRSTCDVRRKRILLDAAGGSLPGSQQNAPVEIVCHPKVNNNTNYLYIAVSEDARSFGPVGTVFVATWSAINEGRPLAYVPSPGLSQYDGVTPVLNSRSWGYINLGTGIPFGPGGKWRSASYTTACDVGPGLFAMGSADNGLDVMLMYDAVLDGLKPTAAEYAAIARGVEYYRQHFQVLHGPYCNGPDIPLPWGENVDCDAFMRRCGYAP